MPTLLERLRKQGFNEGVRATAKHLKVPVKSTLKSLQESMQMPQQMPQQMQPQPQQVMAGWGQPMMAPQTMMAPQQPVGWGIHQMQPQQQQMQSQQQQMQPQQPQW